MMALSSLKQMKGCEGRQEGIYASSDWLRPGGSLPQNELGLTVLPGSQIQQTDEKPYKVANGGGRASPQIPTLIEDPKSSFEADGLANSKCKGLGSRKGHGGSHKVASGKHWDMSQTLAWIEERKISLADKELEASKRNQRLSFQGELPQHVGESRPRYGHNVRGWKKAPQDEKSNRSHKRRKIESTDSASHATSKAIIARASPPGNGAASPNGNGAIPPPAGYSQNTPPLPSNRATKYSPSSLTSLYPICPHPPFSSHGNPTSSNSSPTTFPENEGRQPIVRQEIINMGSDHLYKRMQAELSQIKSELHNKTRAESDAQWVINDLRKAYNDLCNSANAYADLQKAHSSLLLEHGQVLNLYSSLAYKHSSCRGASSKKLAQRIIESRPPSNDSTYVSRSSSIAAPLTFASNIRADIANERSHLGVPLIDLMTTGLPVPRSPAATPAPDLEHCSSNAEQHNPNADQDKTNTEHDDPNYASINGFDEEANELYNALWEQEMTNWDAEEGVELKA